MHRSPLILSAALALGLGAAFAAPVLSSPEAGATHPFSVHDMLAMDRISDLRVSPDGKRILFNVRETDLEGNRGRTDIWVVGVDGAGLRRLTAHPASDFNARWSPCGACVFFLSTRSGSAQVWRISIDGGEAEQVTKLPLDVGNLIVAPARGVLAATMGDFPGGSEEATASRRVCGSRSSGCGASPLPSSRGASSRT